MSKIIDTILKSLSSGWQIQEVYIGSVWTAAFVEDPRGKLRAGLAANSYTQVIESQTDFKRGSNVFKDTEALSFARLAQSSNQVLTAVGIAVINALLTPNESSLADIDAADWLREHGKNKNVVVVGRFPFIEELLPVVATLSVLELRPQAGEHQADEAPDIIPHADILAITGSSLVNHTLDNLLALANPATKVLLIGPTTPLTPILFDFGVNLLSGIQVVDFAILKASIEDGSSFRRMAGIRRVTLAN